MPPLDEVLGEVLAAWGLAPNAWQPAGSLSAMRGATTYAVIAHAGARYVVRPQPSSSTEQAVRFRQAFMQHLRAADLPVPPLLPRPDGTTYALVAGEIWELQGLLAGERFVSQGPSTTEWLRAAGSTLGALHQASATFAWQPQRWPEERAAPALALAYTDLLHRASEAGVLEGAVAEGLRLVAERCAERIAPAAEALAALPGPPALHVHGDYQPHNLAFGPRGVAALYDFDAARWEARVLELAYSLLWFAGARWEAGDGHTPPLVADGLDILRAHTYLAAYGREAPPAPEEAPLLADALALVFPIVLANGMLEDLVFAEDYDSPPATEDALARLQWAETFWLWLDRFREPLAQAWASGS